MAMTYLTKSRHGTTFYFRRRVPKAAKKLLGHSMIVQSLLTSDRRLAIIRGRLLAVHTDSLFQRIAMATKSKDSDDITFNYEMKFDFNDFGGLSSISVKAEPEEQEAVDSAIRTALAGERERVSDSTTPSSGKRFSEAVTEYFAKSQTKAQTKKTYRSKLDHALKFFGDHRAVLEIDQADFVGYCDHVLETVENPTSQSHYMTTVATFLNWHRVRSAGLPQLTTKTLIPKRETPESNDRDAFSLERVTLIFENVLQYRRRNPCKFWVSIAPVFLGCRIEELCQVHLDSDLVYDEDAGIWYFVFDSKPDPDGVTHKSMKKVSSWRNAPVHASLVKHGFIEFLKSQRQAGFVRPFQKEWKPLETTSELGQTVKWSHYISGWGGRELKKIAAQHGFDPKTYANFHSMRHTFKQVLGNAGVSSEISEALSGRRYGGADAERYEKLKHNHRRLFVEGICSGLDQLARILDRTLADTARK